MDVIKLLPDSVANQIAAGEVIQRPASVVKELVENSIDAGATMIQIVIKDAGRTLIQVIDNGRGMSTTDARMAFERHATSKIRQATDLFSLHTMGFRGEALPSIAAVSEIELRTMATDQQTGTRLCISASKVESQQPDICATGTNIMVKRLFFNLPARRKFLKKDTIELGHIMREFERLALVNTSVGFTITHNDVVLHKLSPATLKQRIADLFGKPMEKQLLEISTDTSLVKLSGFVSLPEYARKRQPLQFFFVNGRHMRHPYFHKALLNCYDQLIAADMQPCYFINFAVEPETIDVNIHPQKNEIKFENEQPIWQILTAAVKESLGRVHAMGALDFEAVDVPDIPAFDAGAEVTGVPADSEREYNPFEQAPVRTSITDDWQKLYEGFERRAPAYEQMRGSMINTAGINIDTIKPDEQPPALIEEVRPATPVMFQLKARYIVLPSKGGLMLIDQHRAHVAVLYQGFMDKAQHGEVPVQRLIFPETVTLDPAQNVVVTAISDMLSTMGFDISNLGDNTWAINGVPSMLTKVSAVDALMRIIASVSDDEGDVEQSQWHSIALSMARSAAIKYGTQLTAQEMTTLVSDLFKLSQPDYTPDGRQVISTIDMEQINSLF